MITISEIIQRAKIYLPSLNEARISLAFGFAEEAHRDQKRFSGEPYIVHPLCVTEIFLDFHPDEDSIIAALLHDVVEDTNCTLDDIEKRFGKHVRDLCWGMEKLSKVRSKLDDPQAENLRKLFLAMAKDFRVVLLKLCDRLHNMRTLEFVRPEKRRRIAQETLNVYAPIAARLGIYRLKSQLEDLCFQNLSPEEYNNIQDQLKKTGKGREKYIELSKKILMETFAREGIQAQIDGRVKSIYSIYRKMQRKGKVSVDEIFDVFAMRVILPDIFKHGGEYIGHVYTALGILHNTFTPLANRFKDYIAVPKVNGYRSLHTTVVGLGPKEYTRPTEVQIRTASMHQSAEFGIAAHWLYEEGASIPLNAEVADSAKPTMNKHMDWISGLHKIEGEISSNQELLENLQVDVFHDRIFVLTPRGDVKDLPAEATPIDFAYVVHTEVGNRCVGANVNGNIVPLNHTLKSGDVVEVMTRKNASPSRMWLTFVKTNHARNRIRSWFRDLDVTSSLKEGRLLLNEKLKQLGKSPLDDKLLLLKEYGGNKLTYNEREQVLVEIGKGTLIPSAAVKKIFTIEELLVGRPQRGIGKKRTGGEADAPRLSIGGEMDMPYHFVKCCDAKYSDDLVGYITRGRGVSVHKKDCLVVKNSEPSRLVLVQIAGSAAGPAKYIVNINIEMIDRMGLIRDITQTIADSSINIIKLSNTTSGDYIYLDVSLEIDNFDQLERLLSNLENIPNVRRAIKVI